MFKLPDDDYFLIGHLAQTGLLERTSATNYKDGIITMDDLLEQNPEFIQQVKNLYTYGNGDIDTCEKIVAHFKDHGLFCGMRGDKSNKQNKRKTKRRGGKKNKKQRRNKRNTKKRSRKHR